MDYNSIYNLANKEELWEVGLPFTSNHEEHWEVGLSFTLNYKEHCEVGLQLISNHAEHWEMGRVALVEARRMSGGSLQRIVYSGQSEEVASTMHGEQNGGRRGLERTRGTAALEEERASRLGNVVHRQSVVE